MTEVNQSPILVVAGVRNEVSLGWSAVETWLARDPNNQVLVTVRSDKGREFVEERSKELDGRIAIATIDWKDTDASNSLNKTLTGLMGKDRAVSGVVHAVAKADQSNFRRPAHELDPQVYNDALNVSTISLIRLIRGSRDHLRNNGGIVTFGFGEPRRVVEGYGGAMSVAKVALSQLVAELAVSLGRSDPPARTAEIVTGYIPTHAGRAVALLQRIKPSEVEEKAIQASPLKSTSSDSQRIAAGQIAVSFIADPMYGQSTGQRFSVDGGLNLIGPELFLDR